jgi:hypothetical protein
MSGHSSPAQIAQAHVASETWNATTAIKHHLGFRRSLVLPVRRYVVLVRQAQLVAAGLVRIRSAAASSRAVWASFLSLSAHRLH